MYSNNYFLIFFYISSRYKRKKVITNGEASCWDGHFLGVPGTLALVSEASVCRTDGVLVAFLGHSWDGSGAGGLREPQQCPADGKATVGSG